MWGWQHCSWKGLSKYDQIVRQVRKWKMIAIYCIVQCTRSKQSSKKCHLNFDSPISVCKFQIFKNVQIWVSFGTLWIWVTVRKYEWGLLVIVRQTDVDDLNSQISLLWSCIFLNLRGRRWCHGDSRDLNCLQFGEEEEGGYPQILLGRGSTFCRNSIQFGHPESGQSGQQMHNRSWGGFDHSSWPLRTLAQTYKKAISVDHNTCFIRYVCM